MRTRLSTSVTASALAIASSCASAPSTAQVQASARTPARAGALAERFLEVYAVREDFDGLMAFYADDAEVVDMIYGNKLVGKEAIAGFLAWDKAPVSVVGDGPALIVERQVGSGHAVATEGYFRPFVFNGERLGPWRFTIWLTFNAEGKIVQETDWINYTPREKYLGGENMNAALARR